MQRAAERVFYGSCTIPLVAGTSSYKLPDGTLYSGAKRCTGKVDFFFKDGSRPIQKADFRGFYDNTEVGPPNRYALAGEYLHVRPIPVSNENWTLMYPYFPTAIAAGSTEIDFLEGFEPMIALEAARMSMIKDEADLSDLRVELQQYWIDFRETFCGNRIEGEPDVQLEDMHEDSDL